MGPTSVGSTIICAHLKMLHALRSIRLPKNFNQCAAVLPPPLFKLFWLRFGFMATS